jgi:tetratricopeptide (TPR) repeat protein
VIYANVISRMNLSILVIINEYGYEYYSAWKKEMKIYNNFKEEEALHYINLTLDLDERHANNWNRKGIILEVLNRFDESEVAYNRAIDLSKSSVMMSCLLGQSPLNF